MPTFSVRPAEPNDADAIRALALDNHMFEPDDMGDFDGMLDGYYAGELTDHTWLVATDEHRVVAAAYVAPEPFADRMWNLYFLATAPDAHGTGAGSVLIDHVEDDLRGRGEVAARTLVVDTSSLDGYEGARRFYRGHGFVEEARVRDFYGPGDHKVTFWKSLVAPARPAEARLDPAIRFEWRGTVTNDEVNELHAAAFSTRVFSADEWNWVELTAAHSLGWVAARDGERLVGFANVLWDGLVHAWIQDVMVDPRDHHRGIGTQLVAEVVTAARAAGCEWLHVDFEDDLRDFYFAACDFTPTNAGLIRLS